MLRARDQCVVNKSYITYSNNSDMEEIIAKRVAIAKNCAQNAILHCLFKDQAADSNNIGLKVPSVFELQKKKENNPPEKSTVPLSECTGTYQTHRSLDLVRAIIKLKSFSVHSPQIPCDKGFNYLNNNVCCNNSYKTLEQDSGFYTEECTERTQSEQFVFEKTNYWCELNNFNKKDNAQIIFTNLIDVDNDFLSDSKILQNAIDVLKVSSEVDIEVCIVVFGLMKSTIKYLRQSDDLQKSAKEFRIIQEICKASVFTLMEICFITEEFIEVVEVLSALNFTKENEEELVLNYTYHLLDTLQILLQDMEKLVSTSISNRHLYIKQFWNKEIQQLNRQILLERLVEINSSLSDAFVKLSHNHLMANVMLFLKECIVSVNCVKKYVVRKK